MTSHGLTSRVSQLWDDKTGACNPGPWGQDAAPTARAAQPSGAGFTAAWRPSWTVPASRAW